MTRVFVLLAIMLPAATAFAQATGTVSGTIRIAPGQPLVRANLWSLVGERLYGAHTDSLGRFRFEAPAGRIVLEVLCPWSIGDRFVAPSALKRDVSVVEGSNVDFSAVLDRGACVTREPRTVRGHWRGRYSSAFEESQFTPCPVDPITREVRSYGHPFGRRAWVNFSKTVWKKPGLGGLAFDSTNSRDYGFVEWSGTLYGPEKSGHMGMSNYLLTVDSIFRMSPTGECDVR